MKRGSLPAETEPEQAPWEPVPIACALTKADLEVRRDRWLELAGRGGIEVASTENGLRLTFPGTPGVEEELRQLAELERDCCAFADWSVRSGGGKVVLDVTAASEMGIAVVQGMFHVFARQEAAPAR